MADEIKQQLGFDAAQALAELAKLNKAFDTFGNNIDQLAGKLRNFNGSSRNTEVATGKLASAFNSNMGASAESVGRLTTSMQLMSRIVFTQFIIQQLRVLKDTFQDTTESAIQFQRKVAEISTIAPGATQEQLGRSVRDISDNLNIPLLDTASGVYQALSNNIGGVAESLQLTETAARFAKATNSSLADSVDLLSGSINAFGLSVNDAERLSGVFFKAIETGRVTASELANSLGRVQGRAAALGVDVETTAAALAVVTTSGINSSEAITQLGGVLTALTKPTDEMAAALKRLGFESSEAAIATLGLPELLKRIGDTTDGTSQSLAKLFPNVRGIAGQLNLTNKNLDTFADLITNAKSAGTDFANSKFLQATATDAERFTSEINKLRNALTVDLGQSLLKTAADTAQFVGGADNVIAAVKTLTPLVIGTGAALAGYALSARAAATASALLATRLGPVGAALFAIGAASSAAQAVGRIFFSTPNGLQDLDRATKKSLEDFKKAEAEKVAAFDRANQERVQIALQTVADLNRTYLQDRDNAQAANDALLENTKKRVRDIVGVREKLVDELARSAADAQRFITDSQIRVADLQQGQNDRRFDDSISRLSAAQQTFALMQRAQQQAQAASKAILAAAQAGDERALQRALTQFDAAQATNERAQAVAKTTGQRFLELRAANQIHTLESRRLNTERQLQRLQAERIAQLDREREKQQEIVDRTRAAGKLLIDNLNLFGKDDKLLPQDELLERQSKRQKALAELQNIALSSKDLDVAKVLGLADFVSRFENELKRDPVNLALDVQGETQRIQAQLTQSFDKFSVKLGFDVTALEQVLQRKFSTPDEVSQGLVDARKRAAEIEKQIADSATERRSLGALRTQVDVIAQIISDLESKLRADRTHVGDTFRAFAADFRAVSQQAVITDEDVRRLFNQLDSVRKISQGGIFGTGIGKVELGNLPELAEGLLKLRDLQRQRNAVKAIEVQPGTLDQLRSIKSVIDTIQPTAFQSAASAISRGASASERIASSFERAATAAGRLSIQPTLTAQAPRGVETTIQQAGSTSTVNLGGITVNAAPGTNGKMLANEIATELNRALRRGSAQLRV
jgi:TP901 family phage tail tape measure protein